RGVADARIFLTNNTVNIFYAAMAFMRQERVQDQLSMRRQLELARLQVLHENLHFRNKDFHGAGWLGGSNFTTSLYRTITITIKMKTTLACTIRSFIRRLRSRPNSDSMTRRRITPPSRIGIGMMFKIPRFKLISAMNVNRVTKPA